MSFNFKGVRSIFYPEEKEKKETEKHISDLQKKTNTVFGTTESTQPDVYNPFVNNKSGKLFNPLLDYQKILDNPDVSQMAKKYISQATGLLPTVKTSAPAGYPKQIAGDAGGQSNFNASHNTAKKAQGAVSGSGNAIADAAQKYIGTPYVWGGESMSEGGMDCSGFVYNALKDAGYNVGRTTAQGYRSQGTVISKAEMQPGDLIFYGKNSNDASHIGIYIGNGQMIHSSGGSKNTKSNPGKGVSIANVDYRSDFIEARRY